MEMKKFKRTLSGKKKLKKKQNVREKGRELTSFSGNSSSQNLKKKIKWRKNSQKRKT